MPLRPMNRHRRLPRHRLPRLMLMLLIGSSACLMATQAQPCADDGPMQDSQLLGQWTGTIEGQAGTVQLQLGPHPQWKGTVKGTIERHGSEGARRPMVGDVDDGTVTLEESEDGQRISATWLGTVVEGSCAREIRGDYLEGEDAGPKPFVLRKLGP